MDPPPRAERRDDGKIPSRAPARRNRVRPRRLRSRSCSRRFGRRLGERSSLGAASKQRFWPRAREPCTLKRRCIAPQVRAAHGPRLLGEDEPQRGAWRAAARAGATPFAPAGPLQAQNHAHPTTAPRPQGAGGARRGGRGRRRRRGQALRGANRTSVLGVVDPWGRGGRRVVAQLGSFRSVQFNFKVNELVNVDSCVIPR